MVGRKLVSEADVAGHVSSDLCHRVLEPLASHQHPGAEVEWFSQPLADMVRLAIEDRKLPGTNDQGHMEGTAAAVGPGAGLAGSGPAEAEVAAAAAAAAGAGPSGGSGGSLKRKADLVAVLVVAEGPEPAAKRRKIVCAGEVKRIPRLCEDKDTPADLLAAYRDRNHNRHQQAREVVGQIYTYMLLLRICHGFVTCWNATWLAHVPPTRRGDMYLSRPFLAATGSPDSSGRPAATMLGTLAWLQLQALTFALSGQHVAEPPSTAPGPPVVGGGQGGRGGGSGDEPDAGGGSSGSGTEAGEALDSADPSYCPSSRSSLNSSTSSGALLQRVAATQEPSGAAALECAGGVPGATATATPGQVGAAAAGGANHLGRPAPAAPPVEVYCGDVLAEGSNGPVFNGTCNGNPAVIKLFTWEAAARDAYCREVAAYRALAPLQGHVVPKLMCHGRLPHGLRYIALQPVEDGRPLSSCATPLERGIVNAAISALREVQAACPGFVHGDLRLENMLLLGDAAGSGEARCVLLDFGWSRFDGGERQQQQERAQMARLLGSAAGV